MGQMSLIDAYIAATSSADIATFSLADVENVFAALRHVRYQQDTEFRGIRFSAVRAGRTIGGSIWHIQKDLVR